MKKIILIIGIALLGIIVMILGSVVYRYLNYGKCIDDCHRPYVNKSIYVTEVESWNSTNWNLRDWIFFCRANCGFRKDSKFITTR